MRTTTGTAENFRLLESFAQWPANTIIRVIDRAAWPAFAHLNTERLPDSATWNFEFNAADHARVEQILNSPPPQRPHWQLVPFTVILDRLFDGDLTKYETAQALNFPSPDGYREDPPRSGRRTTVFYDNRIREWLTRMNHLAKTLPDKL